MEQILELFRLPATLVQAARLRELGLSTDGEFERSLGRLPPNEGINHRPTAGDVDALTRSDHDLWWERALLARNRRGRQLSLRVARDKTGGMPINFPEPRLREFGACDFRRGR